MARRLQWKLIPRNLQLLTERVDGWCGAAGPLSTLPPGYLSRTEVHVFGFSIAASVLLSLYPFLNVMASLAQYVFKSGPAALSAPSNSQSPTTFPASWA